MSALTKRDVIDAAMSVAEDVAESRLDPTQLNQAVADECREFFCEVVGEGNPLWELHCTVARQAIALGALTADELQEWSAVMRHRAGEPLSAPQPKQPPIDTQASTSAVSGAHDAEIDLPESDLSTAPEPEPDPEPEPEPEQAAPATDTNASPMVELPDGRRIHRRHIIARGRELPTDNGLRVF